MAMTEKERWDEAMAGLRGEPLTLSPKMSGTLRKSMTGFLHILARYKFAMKMMLNRSNITILDFGCNDGLGDLMLRQNLNAKSIVGIDFDSEAISWAKDNLQDDVLSFQEKDFFDYVNINIVGGGGRLRSVPRRYRTHTRREGKTIQGCDIRSSERQGICCDRNSERYAVPLR